MYFPHRTFVSDVSEIPISFPFPELPFPISFPIKNMKTVTVLVFSDRFRLFSSLLATMQTKYVYLFNELVGLKSRTSLLGAR